VAERKETGLPPEEEVVTSRDETAEPSGEEDPANEQELLEEKEAADDRAAPAEEAADDRAAPAEEAADDGTAPTGEAAPPPAEAEDPLTRAERERDEYLDLARRAQADFENYRKRAAKEATAAGQRAKSGLVRELLPVVDNLERALASAGEEEQHLAEGVRLVHSELIAVLERNGVEQFDPRGERFDPGEHEALSMRSEDWAESGTVLDVVEKGYRANGAILRPARVVVSS
jgi:molecular chaperone GrpE